MRNIFATAALFAASAQAIKQGRFSDAISAITGDDESEAAVCATGNGVNEEYDSATFQGSLFWRNRLGWWWQQYSVEDSFAYFDCEHGNNDGAITFDEFQEGWKYVTGDQNCTEQWYDTWLMNYSNTSHIVDRTGYLAGQENFIQNDTAVTFNGHEGLYHKDFYGMIDWKFDYTREEAARMWLASNVPDTQVHNGNVYINQDDYSEQWRNIYKDVWQYWVEVDLTNTNDETEEMPLHFWYAAQSCFAPESYWTAMTGEYESMPWETETSYDSAAWGNALCEGLGIGCSELSSTA